MPTNPTKRQNIWMPLLFSTVLVGGMFIGFKLNETLSNKRSINTAIERNDRVEEIIDLITSRYVETIPEDTLYQDAVEGVLQHLDPHTYYLNAKEAGIANESIEGNFKGIGVEFYIVRDTVIIISVAPGGPSEKVGIRVGDRLIAIENNEVSGLGGVSDDDVRQKMMEVTKANIALTIQSPNGTVRTINVVRGNVPINSVDASYMLNAQVGYVKLNRFSATTTTEFLTSIAALRTQGMKSLVFDLRQNPGGLLDEAISVLDAFIPGKQLLVYTSGKSNDNVEYFSSQTGAFEEGNLVILIDEASASASEVVAGGVQDLDRGVIIGRTSFGKGLIQEQFELSDGSALRLTVAKYYTPSGRPIQKNYDKRSGAYPTVEQHNHLGNERGKDVMNASYKTLNKQRAIHAFGGGVHPDMLVAVPPFMLSPDLWTILELIDAYSNSYFATHINEFLNYSNFEHFYTKYIVSKEHLLDYKNHLPPKYIQSINTVWKQPQMTEYLKVRIKANYARFLYRGQGYYQVINKTDEEIKAAIQIIQSNNYSKILNQAS